MSWTEARAMQASGLLTFGAHTYSHPHLPTLAPTGAEREVTRARVRIAEQLGAPVDLFAYPYGEFTATTQQIVEQAGFRAAFGVEARIVTPTTPCFAIPRIPVLDWGVSMLEYRILRAWAG